MVGETLEYIYLNLNMAPLGERVAKDGRLVPVVTDLLFSFLNPGPQGLDSHLQPL